MTFRSVAAILTLSVVLSGCGKTPPNLTPQQTVLYHANDVVVALGTAQHAAIGLNAIPVCDTAMPPVCHPLLSNKNTGIVVDAVTDALTSIKALPSGWKATADAAIVRIEGRLDAAGKGSLVPYLEAVRIIIRGGA